VEIGGAALILFRRGVESTETPPPGLSVLTPLYFSCEHMAKLPALVRGAAVLWVYC
jgi:hypothetical protein